MAQSDVLTQLTTLVLGSSTGGSLQQNIAPSTGVNDGTAAVQSRLSDQLSAITRQLDSVRTSQQAQADTLLDNTKALTDNTASRAAALASGVAQGALGLLGGGLGGLSPVLSGILSLFGIGGGSSSAAVNPLTKYAAPPSLNVNGGVSGGDIFGVDYNANGVTRSTQSSAPQVMVQVQAMDSQSFLDHSDQIARAVRQAMLQSNSLNDVVADL